MPEQPTTAWTVQPSTEPASLRPLAEFLSVHQAQSKGDLRPLFRLLIERALSQAERKKKAPVAGRGKR